MMIIRFQFLILVLTISTVKNRMATAEYTLDSVRKALVRQEDTIVFALIERAKFPFNSLTYDHNYLQIPGFCGSLVDFVVNNTEGVQAKVNNFIICTIALSLLGLAIFHVLFCFWFFKLLCYDGCVVFSLSH